MSDSTLRAVPSSPDPVDVILTQQREGWRRGEPETVETLRERLPGSGTRVMLDLIRGEIELRRERGEDPGTEEYRRRFPEVAAEIAGLFVDGAAMGARREGTASWSPSDGLRAGLEPLPGYRLVARLGEGGFGEVWKAEGPGGFPLALKFVKLGGAAGATESRALEVIKGIRHPNLLSIVGAWRVDTCLIIAMELADGTLADRLEEALDAGSTGIPGPELLEFMREAAKGIDFLNEPRHAVGGKSGIRLQHRDIKPANILLVGGGVKVADFGLTRLVEGTLDSHTGAMSPAYAAPEFFAGRTSTSSDQYSLAVAYCVLRGGRLPFQGTLVALMHGHVGEPPDLSMLPEAERAAVARALAKAPGDRWPSCRRFVEALTAAQGLPAPATSSAPAARRRASRLRFSLGIAVVLGLVGWFATRPVVPPRDPVPSIAMSGPATEAPAATEPRPTPALPKGDVKSVPVTVQERPVAREPVRFALHEGAVRCLAWHPRGDLALSGGDDGTIRAWDPRTGEQSLRLNGHEGPVRCLAVSPDGSRLLTGGADGTVRLWDLAAGRQERLLAGHTAIVEGVAISPDGRWGVSAGQDTTVRVWDLAAGVLASGRAVHKFGTEGESVWSVAFAADGRHVLTAGDSPIVRIWDVEAEREAGRFTGHEDSVLSVAGAASSDWAASGGGDDRGRRDDRLLVWRASDGRSRSACEGHRGAIGAVAITPDGRLALSGSVDRTARLWDAATGRELGRFEGHRDKITAVALSPDGRRALSGDLAGIAYAWTPTPSPE